MRWQGLQTQELSKHQLHFLGYTAHYTPDLERVVRWVARVPAGELGWV